MIQVEFKYEVAKDQNYLHQIPLEQESGDTSSSVDFKRINNSLIADITKAQLSSSTSREKSPHFSRTQSLE